MTERFTETYQLTENTFQEIFKVLLSAVKHKVPTPISGLYKGINFNYYNIEEETSIVQCSPDRTTIYVLQGEDYIQFTSPSFIETVSVISHGEETNVIVIQSSVGELIIYPKTRVVELSSSESILDGKDAIVGKVYQLIKKHFSE